ncbi:MAG: hypothetical protein E6R00_03215 [Gammaproteobacteria bacterium]|nr:MAG: hypothetical protein E6R00_03215 [Gammaproteobacteria bacterium]
MKLSPLGVVVFAGLSGRVVSTRESEACTDWEDRRIVDRTATVMPRRAVAWIVDDALQQAFDVPAPYCALI